MENNIETLREHLFATLTALQDKSDPMDIDRAKAISEVSQTIINSAKVEIEYAKIKETSDHLGTGFMEKIDFEIPSVDKKPELPNGINSIYQHKIR